MFFCSYVKKIYPYVLLSFIVLLSACNAEDSVYREYRCYFIFDTQLHPMPCQLTGIIGNPGHFCKIEASQEKGVRHIKVVCWEPTTASSSAPAVTTM